jgi:predicted transcriptional regulator YdeE
MNIEIQTTPIHFQLHGKSAAVENNRFGETGVKLMNEMWRGVKESETPNEGQNHWVHLPDGRMFVGIVLAPGVSAPQHFETLTFELRRYLKHTHIGPYQLLPEKWKALKTELTARGETISNTFESPALEIYGHHCDEVSKLETTILIGLKDR